MCKCSLKIQLNVNNSYDYSTKRTRRQEFISWMILITFHNSTNTLGKGMNPIILPPAMGQ